MRAGRTVPGPRPSILLLGPTGSGKTPLGQEIERRGLDGRRCVHFDFGSNLRRLAAGSDRNVFLKAADLARIRLSLASGSLFEDRDMPMIVRILRSFVEARAIGSGILVVLNGLPRHRGQAEGLAETVAVERVVLLEAEAPVILERIRLDPGGDRSGRSDDTLEAVGKRLSDYRERTLPLLEYYRERGVPVKRIPVTAAMTAREMYGSLSPGPPQGGERNQLTAARRIS
jgi:adenylate kinase family enzyme